MQADLLPPGNTYEECHASNAAVKLRTERPARVPLN